MAQLQIQTESDWQSSSALQNIKALSNREKQCLKYVMKGYSNQEIANAMFLSVRTVETYIDNIKAKLEVRRRGEVIDKVLVAARLDGVLKEFLTDL